ncbi:MAG: ester cyclase [Solirubrobacterales bacterium]
MAADANIEASRRAVEEAFGQGKLDVMDEICAKDFVGHDPLAGEQDLAAAKESIAGYRDAFPDLTFTIDDIVASDDKVCIRWRAEGTFENEFMGQAPTGEKGEPTEGISIDRFDDDGKIAETWNQWDTVGFLREIGMIPEGAAAAS